MGERWGVRAREGYCGARVCGRLQLTSTLPAAQAINDVICTYQRPGTCDINWVDTVDGGRRRRLRDGTTMTCVISIPQDASDVSTNATTSLAAATRFINTALAAKCNGNVIVTTNQRPGAYEINWVDTVDGGRRRRLGDGTTMTYVITITQDVSSDVSMNAATTLLTAATINAALEARGNGNVVIATEPVQDQAALSLTVTTAAKGSTCVKGNEGVMCAVCKSLGGLSRASEVRVTHAA